MRADRSAGDDGDPAAESLRASPASKAAPAKGKGADEQHLSELHVT